MMQTKISGIALFFIVVLLLNTPWTHSEKQPAYVGDTRCAPCHADITAGWKTTRHATAIESLKKTRQEHLPACVKCHVTGYEKDGGFIDYELTPEMANVQCEECHGPGGNHVSNPMGGGMIKAPSEESCRQCHTEGQDPGFDYATKIKEVHGLPN